ncbi:MAG: aspartate ammonia-lyase, partial [Cenarchaeum sp. SB0664_bin_35]|nr:aspartate ammonia-lyase [Cenarchaeum sp. SB0664_bin_35]
MSFRYDEDSLGSVEVPREAYYGAFTARALKQYVVTGHASHPDLRDSFVMIKRSAARANMQTGAIDAKKGDAITRACDEILGGKLTEWFVVDMINSGAGTAFNMNTNEVIANAALRIIGKDLGEYQYLHPNDHVNMSQSSNDTYPTAMHMSILMGSEKLEPELHLMKDSLQSKADQFNKFRKIGRTHLMDALPITLGDEFASYAVVIFKCSKVLQYTAAQLYPVALGVTEVGSGP